MISRVVLVCAGLAGAQIGPQAHYARGLRLLQDREFAQAAVEFQAALKQNERFAEAHHGLGLVRLAENNPMAASQELRRAVELKPELAEGHLALGLALGQTGDLEGAAAEFRKAIRLRPRFGEAHKRLGITLRRLGDANGALAEFQAAVESAPRDAESWYHLGLLQKSQGDLDSAIDDWQRAVALKPDLEQARYNLGMALRARGHQQAGQAQLDEIRGLREFRSKLAQSKAMILQGVEALQQGDNDRAFRLFEQASVDSPTLPTAWHYLGVTWERKGDPVKAMDAWRKALDLQPDYPKPHASIGLLYARNGDFEGASREFRQVVAADPDDPEGHYNLGLALAKTGRFEDALAQFDQAISLNPKYTDARIQMGLVLSAKGDPAAAAKIYREMIRENPQKPEVYNNLGLALLEDNDFARARSAFQTALKLNPTFGPAQENLKLTEPCEATDPKTSLTIPHAATAADLNTDPSSALWYGSSRAAIRKDCTYSLDHPGLHTEVHAFWTDNDIYFLFICPYRKLNVFLPAQNDKPRLKLWDRDVVEIFLGDDWTNIGRYREFEMAPTGDWIDLAIDLDRKKYDHSWRSGWQVTARIDESTHIWYAAARIPLSAISTRPVQPGTRWRMNLYRIEGQGPDSKRHFLCWQPTCVRNRDPNHVPENFGTLVFE